MEWRLHFFEVLVLGVHWLSVDVLVRSHKEFLKFAAVSRSLAHHPREIYAYSVAKDFFLGDPAALAARLVELGLHGTNQRFLVTDG